MKAPPFPLPAGHRFGLRPGDLQTHDGRRVSDGRGLAEWQNRYRVVWDRTFSGSAGAFDGPTQRAVLQVQGVLGVPPTALLGEAEWVAVWESPPVKDPPAETPGNPPENVVHGSTRDGPDWHDGRPFGKGESGPHVRRLRELLGLAPGDRYTAEVEARVRGLQKAHGLPVSGVCDVRIAHAIEEAPRP